MYINRNGRALKLVDRTVGFPKVAFEIEYGFMKLKERIYTAYDKFCKLFFNRSKTGVYVIRNGRSVKISDRANAVDIWFKKWRIDGVEDRKKTLRKSENDGSLKRVGDSSLYGY